MRVAVCAAGVGNVRSVVRALERAATTGSRSDVEIVLTGDPDAIRKADAVIVPGQGAFGAFAAALDGGLREALLEQIRAGKPYFGICLGMQILFAESDEDPGARGLAVFEGRVGRLDAGIDPATGEARPLPHIGWNLAQPSANASQAMSSDRALLDQEKHFYFAHSYIVRPADPSIALAWTEYGERFVSAVMRDNVSGVQFHPEKSQRAGLSLLERFFGGL